MSGVEELGEVKVMDLRPGDILVLELREDADLSQYAAERIREQFKEAFPDHRLVVVANGTLGLVRGEAAKDKDKSPSPTTPHSPDRRTG